MSLVKATRIIEFEILVDKFTVESAQLRIKATFPGHAFSDFQLVEHSGREREKISVDKTPASESIQPSFRTVGHFDLVADGSIDPSSPETEHSLWLPLENSEQSCQWLLEDGTIVEYDEHTPYQGDHSSLVCAYRMTLHSMLNEIEAEAYVGWDWE